MKEFTKNNLENGMVVELRDGTSYIVMTNKTVNRLVNDGGFLNLDEYNEVLTESTELGLDIMKIWEPDLFGFDDMYKHCQDKQPIWQRSEVDWSKVAVDTKIEVRQKESEPWKPAYFKGYRSGSVFAWNNGRTSFTIMSGIERDQPILSGESFRYSRLYKED